jgi:hypothetical protein
MRTGGKKVRDTLFGKKKGRNFDKRFPDFAPSSLMRGITWK